MSRLPSSPVLVAVAASLALAGCAGVAGTAGGSLAPQSVGTAPDRAVLAAAVAPSAASAATSTSQLLVAERTDPGDVAIFSASTLAALPGTIAPLAGPEGVALAVDPFSHLAYVSETDAGDVKIYSRLASPPKLVATIGGLSSPSGVAVDGLGCRLYVTASGGVHVYAATSTGYAPVTTLGSSVGIVDPGGLAVDVYQRRLYVAQGTGNVEVFDTGDLTKPVATITGLDNPGGVAVDSAHDRAYVTENYRGDVRAYDTAFDRYAYAGTVATGLNTPFGDAYDPTTGRLFVNEYGAGDVRAIGLSPQTAPQVVGGLRAPWAVAVDLFPTAPAGTAPQPNPGCAALAALR